LGVWARGEPRALRSLPLGVPASSSVSQVALSDALGFRVQCRQGFQSESRPVMLSQGPSGWVAPWGPAGSQRALRVLLLWGFGLAGIPRALWLLPSLCPSQQLCLTGYQGETPGLQWLSRGAAGVQSESWAVLQSQGPSGCVAPGGLQVPGRLSLFWCFGGLGSRGSPGPSGPPMRTYANLERCCLGFSLSHTRCW